MRALIIAAAVALVALPAAAQAPKIGGQLGHTLDKLGVQPLGGQPQGSPDGTGSAGGANKDQLAAALAKPFQAIADYINSDVAAAETLSTAIPTLQDGHGQRCWAAMGQFTAVINAHPIPLTLHAATDLEALRLATMAANNLCANVDCTQVFSDLSNAVQQIAGQTGGALVSGGLQIPSLNSLCSKVPQIAVAAPTPGTPAPSPTPVPTPPAAPAPAPASPQP